MQFTGEEILDRCVNDPSAGSPTSGKGGEREKETVSETGDE